MLLLSDEHVPESVASLFLEHGHELRHVRDVLAAGAGDDVVTAAADAMGAIVVTWDKGYRRRIRRSGPLPRAGRILFQCNPATARERLTAVLDLIEFVYGRHQAQTDPRLIVEVRETLVVIHG
jgi:predicted nuclease of predicted toxin-antitoxin system